MIKRKLLASIFMTIYLTTATLFAAAKDEEDYMPLLPDRISIKSPTQTFNSYYYFAIADGKLYCKKNPERDFTDKHAEKNPDEWHLFRETGLPYPPDKKMPFIATDSLVECHADADEIVVISADGLVYLFRLEITKKRKNNEWFDKWGWPTEEHLYFGDYVKNNLSWGIGRRNSEVLWHNDIDGNPHHFGTMGITTLYVLQENGREIRFTDSGLPADFSHCVLTPKCGKTTAVAMSVSASTLFIITETGEMFTRLIDFDTKGGDPMFFKYTYKENHLQENGANWESNFSNWSLPPEDWQKQPSITLLGKARISKNITILQNGQGNAARELRVAGLDKNGVQGYYSNPIFDKEWVFIPENLNIDNEQNLQNLNISHKIDLPDSLATKYGYNLNYSGEVMLNGVAIKGLSVDLLNFCLYESPATLRLHYDDATYDMTLHTVEAWTPVVRKDPGRDGMQQLYLGTIDIGDTSKIRSDSLKVYVKKVFAKHQLETFHFLVEASTEHLYIKIRQDLTQKIEGREVHPQMEMYMAKKGSKYSEPILARQYAVIQDSYALIEKSDSLIIKDLNILTKDDLDYLDEKTDANKKVEKELKRLKKKYLYDRLKLKQYKYIYNSISFLTHITGLVYLDKPKFHTLTRHTGFILRNYDEAYQYTYSLKESDLERAINNVGARILAYEKTYDLLKKGLPIEGQFQYHESLSEYFIDGLDSLHTMQKLNIPAKNILLPIVPEGIIVTLDFAPVFDGQEYFELIIEVGTEKAVIAIEPDDYRRTILEGINNLLKIPDVYWYKANLRLLNINIDKSLEQSYIKQICSGVFGANNLTSYSTIPAHVVFAQGKFIIYEVEKIPANTLRLDVPIN